MRAARLKARQEADELFIAKPQFPAHAVPNKMQRRRKMYSYQYLTREIMILAPSGVKTLFATFASAQCRLWHRVRPHYLSAPWGAGGERQ